MIALLAVAGLLVVGCDEPQDAPPPQSAGSEAADELPAGLVLASAPKEARGVAEARAEAQEGQEIVVRGVVGGREEPFADNRAILTLLDESVQTCDQMSIDDGCETPWDACCTPQETISANSATVQVVDAEGRPLKASLRGVGKLAPLSRIVVVGTAHPSADGQSLVINATGVFVES